MSSEPVPQALYTEAYYKDSCGGSEFYRLYGPAVPKPQLAYALKLGELRAGQRVLDIGCGRGELLYHAQAAGALAVGTDYAEAALGLARTAGGGRALRCDAKALPFAAGTFDRVFLLGVVDHLHDWELRLCFAEIARVLRSGGRVVAQTCTNRHHHKALTYALRRALAAASGLPEPSRPRSDEDESLHVNEHSYGDLAGFFSSIGWEARVEPMPNYKALAAELYPAPRPADLPIRPYGPWRSAFARAVVRTPLGRVLAREFFVVARPSGAKDAAHRILIAEDNPVNQRVALAMTGRLGYPADIVPDGGKAVEGVKTGRYALVLMDCQMPGMDGYQATAAIRGLPSPLKDIPILAATSNTLPGDREKALRAGMDDYLAKPLRLGELGAALSRWLGEGSAQGGGGASPPPIEEGGLAGLRSLGDEGIVKEIVAVYLDDAPRRLEDLRGGLEAGDAERARKAAHTLKGSSRIVGALRLGDQCQSVEEAAKEGDLPRAMDLLPELEEEFSRARTALERL